MENSRKIVVSVVIGILVLIVAASSAYNDLKSQLKVNTDQATQDAATGALAELSKGAASLNGGVAIGSREINFAVSGTLGSGVNQGGYTNKTGRRVVVEYAEARTTGTASTSYNFYVGTSTSLSNTTIDFAAGGTMFSELIDAKQVATSTPNIVVNSIKDSGTNGRGALEIDPGESVLFSFRQTNVQACTGATCETATSTNRGFNVNWLLKAHYIP